MKSELFNYLEDVEFAEKDPSIIESEILKIYEDMTGRTLARADPVRILLNVIILMLIQQRNVIDIAAKNNLLAYASGSYLDHLGALLGVSRLSASHAMCTVRFTLSDAMPFSVIVYEGVRVSAGDGLMFEVMHQGTIKEGELTCDVQVRCTESGEKGNGYAPGQIRKLADIFPYEMSVTNLDMTSGGSEIESDESYRERIQIAPESFSSAGPVNAYAYYARTANSDIIDVSVMGPPDTNPGHVEIYPLMTEGTLPSDEILDEVYSVCNAEDIRPDTDYVHVLRPVTVNYDLNMRYWIDEKNSGSVYEIQARVNSAVDEWMRWTRIRLGRDINPSELTKRIITAGAKRCEIISPVFTKLKKNQLGIMSTKRIVYEGTEEG